MVMGTVTHPQARQRVQPSVGTIVSLDAPHAEHYSGTLLIRPPRFSCSRCRAGSLDGRPRAARVAPVVHAVGLRVGGLHAVAPPGRHGDEYTSRREVGDVRTRHRSSSLWGNCWFSRRRRRVSRHEGHSNPMDGSGDVCQSSLSLTSCQWASEPQSSREQARSGSGSGTKRSALVRSLGDTIHHLVREPRPSTQSVRLRSRGAGRGASPFQ